MVLIQHEIVGSLIIVTRVLAKEPIYAVTGILVHRMCVYEVYMSPNIRKYLLNKFFFLIPSPFFILVKVVQII